ncbi:hypothetical protein B0H13DRAFT_2332420 [Mycena leptocephala]|nr:hypothetical protein B0H13DRAFT_2332420 [Mycena leptocephala]
MNSLASQTSLWQPVNNNFCDWLQVNVVRIAATGMQVIPNLLQCLPYNSCVGINPFMPWLESVANGKKAGAIHRNTLAASSTWKKYSFSKKLSVMRSTAGLISQSNCLKQQWNIWYAAYSQATGASISFNKTGVTVPGGMDSIYTSFIRCVMSQFATRLSTGLALMASLWDDAILNIDISKPTSRVAVNYGIAIQSTPDSEDAENVDLTVIQNSVTNTGLTWWSQL